MDDADEQQQQQQQQRRHQSTAPHPNYNDPHHHQAPLLTPEHQQQHYQHGGGGGGGNTPTKAEYIIAQLNVTNAKKVALLIVIGFMCYHGLLHLRYGTDSCKWLLSDGRFKGDREWQPYGCMMHKYTQADTRRCFRVAAFLGNVNHFVFIGDERVRQLYDAFVEHLRTENGQDQSAEAAGNADSANTNAAAAAAAETLQPLHSNNNGASSSSASASSSASVTGPNSAAAAAAAAAALAAAAAAAKFTDRSDHEYHEYNMLKLRVNFVYANEANDAMLAHFGRWQRDAAAAAADAAPPVPSAIVVGCTHAGLFRGNLSDETLHRYGANLTRLLVPMGALLAGRTKVLWKLQDDVDEEAATLPDEWRAVPNADVQRFNEVARDIMAYAGVPVWSSARRIAGGLLADNVAGWRLSALALRHDVQLLLNMYCNDNMNYNDGSCCSSAEPYTMLQIVTYAVLAVCLILATVIRLRRWWLQLGGHTFYTPLRQNLHPDDASADARAPGTGADAGGTLLTDYRHPIGALARLAIIMTYFYLCDRTNFFMKENKYYSEFSFWIPVGYVFVLGLFFTEDSKYTKVLHRDQTDELKGWMQLVILIYHMTGADRVLPIYMHIKVLISGYLFLSGYGHFTYVWHTGNAGVTRMLQILFRLNFSTVLLCLCMNRPYQFYYYVPLISFWFALVWFVLALPPPVSAPSTAEHGAAQQLLWLVAKVVCLFGVATVLYMSEVFFERVFVTRPWKALFVTTDDDIHEWWYRWKLDRYTMSAGVAFAACFHVAQRHNLCDDNNHGNLFNRRLSILATGAAIAGVGFYTTFTFMCASKMDCDEIHSYVVFIPICGYLVLRNLSGMLRTRFSSFFAWFGRISLELFVCQYHVWLAADRNGVLVLLPGFPNANIIVTSFVFVCIAHEVHRLTHVLLPWAVPNDWRLALRNLAVFCLVVLMPIGRSDGMI